MIKRIGQPTPRPHAELIKLWAEDDSLRVEVYCGGVWSITCIPQWDRRSEYRLVAPKEMTVEEVELLLGFAVSIVHK